MLYLFVGLIGLLVAFVLVSTIRPILRERRARMQRTRALAGLPCRTCGTHNANLYVFRTCRCLGIAPIAATWQVFASESLACHNCAQRDAVAACRELGLKGGWGFPGFLVVVMYTGFNLFELARHRSLGVATLLRCVAWGILLPWGLLATALVALTLVLALILVLVDVVT